MHRRKISALSLAIGLAACTGKIDDGSGGADVPRAGVSGKPGPASAGGAATTAPGGSPPVDRGQADFACIGAPTTPPPPRRLWRLSAKQYATTVAVALTGKRPTGVAPLTAPADVVAPIDALGNEYRFRTYSGTHGLTGFEFGKSVITTEDLARKMVAAVRTGTCWATATVGAAADACVDTLVKDRGAILFRRPLTADELTRYGGYAKTNAASFGRDEALGLAFQAMLLAPQFLFLTELGEPTPGGAGTFKLNPFEIAAAISYSLTDGPADATLWDAASTGALATPQQIAAHVTRIVNSPAATTTAEFVAQYFRLDRVLEIAKSIEKPGEYGRQRILQDARLLVDSVVASSRNKEFLKTLLTTTTGFAGADSYKEYGLRSDPKSNAPVVLPATERAGLLTHPAFLAGFAAFDDTQPVKRGKFVNETLLCRAVPDAPLDVVAKLPPAMNTMREKLAQHSKEPRCAACHGMLDPLGLALEQYDAYGRYRTTQFGQPLDPSGTLTGAGDVDGSFKDAVDLAGKLAGSMAVEHCFIRHGFRYYMGRPEDAYDSCALDAAAKAYRAGSGDLAAAVAALFTSQSFLNRGN